MMYNRLSYYISIFFCFTSSRLLDNTAFLQVKVYAFAFYTITLSITQLWRYRGKWTIDVFILLGLWALYFSLRVKRHHFYRRRTVKVDLNKASMDNKNTIIGPNTDTIKCA